MITIIGSGYKKIVQRFYKDKFTKVHLREIARQTGLHEPSTTRFLQVLEKEGILKAERDGNLKKYGIQKNKKTYLFFELFDLEKFEKLPDSRKRAVEYYLNKLPEKPIFAVLFGSTAKETYSEHSDMDIFLIVNKKIKTKEAEKEADVLTGTKISSFQMRYSDFLQEIKLKQDKVMQSALHTGYPLINHIFYYEVLYNERI